MKKRKYHAHYFMTALICLMTAGFDMQPVTAGYWDTIFDTKGMDGPVRALASGGGYIYAGGEFINAGGVTVNRIARWDGSNWSDMSLGCAGTVHEITTSGNDVYVGGEFTAVGLMSVQHVAKWNSSSGWTMLGNSSIDNGVNGPVHAIAVDGNDVYVGGDFTVAGGAGNAISANNIAKWNGSSWSALGDGITTLTRLGVPVYDILIHGGNVYVGGHFDKAGNVTTKNVAYWDGANWHDMNGGIEGTRFPPYGDKHVLSLTTDGTHIYAGCSAEFTVDEHVDNYGAVYFIYYTDVYQWNGTIWTHLGDATHGCTGGEPNIYKLGYTGGNVYAAGSFSDETVIVGDEYVSYIHTPDIDANRVAYWNGTNWTALGTGLDDAVYSLTVSNSEIWVGGDFMTAGGNPSHKIGRYILDTGISEGLNQTVKTYQLFQNHPNPFNPSTVISYSIPKSNRIHLYIYNLQGEIIATFTNEHNQSGSYEIEWNGKDATGKQVASGVYLYRLVADEFVQTKKMLFVK